MPPHACRAVLLMALLTAFASHAEEPPSLAERTEALRRQPESRELAIELLKALLRAKQAEEGLTLFNGLLAEKETAALHLGAGILAKALNRCDDALPHLRLAAEFYAAHPDAEASLAAWHETGACLHMKNDYGGAIAAWEEAMKHAEAKGDRRRVAGLLGNIGFACTSAERHDEAVSYFERVLPIAEELKNASLLATTLNGLGYVHWRRGDFPKARHFYERALAAVEETRDMPLMSIVLSNLGLVMGAQGDYRQALAMHERALAIEKKSGHPDGLSSVDNFGGLARVHNNIGVGLRTMSRYDEALLHFRESLRLARQTKDKPAVSTALYNVAFVTAALGQDAEALRHYAEVLALQEETGARMEAASTRTSMALLHLDRGEAAEALALLDAVLDRRGDSENRLDLPRALVQRGRAFLMLKRPREAVRDLERAADIGRRENSPYVLNWALVFLSDAWAAMGRTEKAREIAQEALRLVEQSASPAPDGLRRAHMAMAGTERRARRFGEASRHYEAAVGVIEDVRSGLGQSEQRMSFLEKQLNLYEDYSSLLLAMSLDRRGEDAAGAPFRAFHLGERMKARAFLEELGRSRFLREGVAPEMMERRERLEEEVQRLRFLVAKSGETK